MATFDSVNPARPSEVIGTYPAQGAADVDRAVSRRRRRSGAGPACRSPPGPV